MLFSTDKQFLYYPFMEFLVYNQWGLLSMTLSWAIRQHRYKNTPWTQRGRTEQSRLNLKPRQSTWILARNQMDPLSPQLNKKNDGKAHKQKDT